MSKRASRNRTEHRQKSEQQFLQPPVYLSPAAKEEWKRIVGELTALGVLSIFDLGPLAVYCEAFHLLQEASEAIQKYGSMIKTPNGYPVQSPYVAQLNRQADTMLRIATEFGFTPASRSKNFSYAKGRAMLIEAPEEMPGRLQDLHL